MGSLAFYENITAFRDSEIHTFLWDRLFVQNTLLFLVVLKFIIVGSTDLYLY